jgi:hypothetical protein
MRKVLEYAGIGAGAILIAFGIVAIAMGINGRSEVRSNLAAQKIYATPDAAVITGGKLQPDTLVDTGAKARQFARIMEHHALEATGGKRYAEMGRFVTAAGKDTNDEAAAAKTPEGRPVENGLRTLWVTETGLTTALNMAYMAEQLALFGIVVGVALLLAGIGFVVLALGGALRHQETKSAAAVAVRTALI